ncbi:MAG: helix-turn-helix transcriptional regulator [Deltaproteobacteria bacterium]|nr:helix-turn-helix transcriptional regulator [Deltaproteobacteria bacterium]
MKNELTFGQVVAAARKKLEWSQKELAEKVLREDGEPISPQYLNDIERDRRAPTSDHMIKQFADVLKLDKDYLHYLNGRFPEDIRRAKVTQDDFKAAMTAFRKKVG